MNRRPLLIGTIIVIVVLAVAALAIGIFISRSAPAPIADATAKCEYCHGDMERLSQASDSPEKLYVDPTQFAQEVHGGVACTACHGCDTTLAISEPACTNGHAYQNPSDPAVVAQTCGACHPDMAARQATSIHTSLSGIQTGLVDLLGEKAGNDQFQSNCDSCHATCASCHMEDPDRRNMLWPRVTSHHFAAAPESKVCVACHTDMGTTFFGDPNNGPSPMAQAGMQCADCHGDQAVHGTGVKATFMAALPEPTCQECHNQPAPRVTSAKDTLVAPQYALDTPAHQIHENSGLDCTACHTEWYSSCWNCHQGKVDKTIDPVFLAVNPVTKLIQPAAHSPATSGDSGPIPTSVGGGWAIKSRHSWGASQTCEACHTDPAIYVTGADRQAPFIAAWSAQRLNASFVDEKLVQELVIDPNGLKLSAHKDQSCNDCHQSPTNQVCADCHSKTQKTGKTFLPTDGDWTRSVYMNTQASLDQMTDLIQKAQASGINVVDWQKQWSGLKSSYLQASNDFHSNPGQTLTRAKSISSDSLALLGIMQQTMQAKELQNQLTPVGALFGAGVLGALGLGLVVSRRQKS